MPPLSVVMREPELATTKSLVEALSALEPVKLVAPLNAMDPAAALLRVMSKLLAYELLPLLLNLTDVPAPVSVRLTWLNAASWTVSVAVPFPDTLASSVPLQVPEVRASV